MLTNEMNAGNLRWPVLYVVRKPLANIACTIAQHWTQGQTFANFLAISAQAVLRFNTTTQKYARLEEVEDDTIMMTYQMFLFVLQCRHQ